MKTLIVLNALSVNPFVLEDLTGDPVWRETLKRVASLGENYQIVLARLESESLLPATGQAELRLASRSSHGLFKALETGYPECEWFVFIDSAAWMLDPDLIIKFTQTARERIAHYVYGEHYPRGVAPEVLSREALEILVGVSSGTDFPFSHEAIFDLIGLDINSWDIEMIVSEKDFRRMRLDLRLVSAEALRRARALLKLDPDLKRDWSWARLADLLACHPELLRLLPHYIELDLTDTCQLSCRFCPRSLGQEAREQGVSLEEAQTLISEIAALSPDATLALSPFSEPLLHPELKPIIRSALEAGLRLVLETNGILLDRAWAEFLALADPERTIVIVSLDFSDRERYRREKGEDLLALVEENLGYLLSLRSKNIWIQAIQFSGDDEGLEAFYQRWQANDEAILPRKFNNWCGRLEGETAVDLSPLIRTPCWHLARDLVIRADGRVGLCKQDLEFLVSAGNVFKDGLKKVWDSLAPAWEEHLAGPEGHPLCGVCDEWHTFNF